MTERLDFAQLEEIRRQIREQTTVHLSNHVAWTLLEELTEHRSDCPRPSGCYRRHVGDVASSAVRRVGRVSSFLVATLVAGAGVELGQALVRRRH